MESSLYVILPDGQDTYTLELPYQENTSGSTKPGDVLKSGQIPDEYKDVIDSIEIKNRRNLVRDDEAKASAPSAVYVRRGYEETRCGRVLRTKSRDQRSLLSYGRTAPPEVHQEEW